MLEGEDGADQDLVDPELGDHYPVEDADDEDDQEGGRQPDQTEADNFGSAHRGSVELNPR